MLLPDGPNIRLSLDVASVALIQRQQDIDRAEAAQTVPVSGSRHRGVRSESRWALMAELDRMRRIIDAMPELMARRLETIWCGANAGACYAVAVRSGLWAPDLRWALADAVMEVPCSDAATMVWG